MDLLKLREWKITVEDAIAEITRNLHPLEVELATKKEQLKAVEVLMESIEVAEAPKTEHPSSDRHFLDSSRLSNQPFTPAEAYWIPILDSLVERGGKERSDVILDLIEQKMKEVLTPADYELLPSGLSTRWRNRAQWQRKNMVDQGLLRQDSPRGVWEITTEGRSWLIRKKTK